MGWEHAPEAAAAIGAAVLVPLALRVIDERDRNGARGWLLGLARVVVLPASVAVALSFLFAPGGLAIALCTPYLVIATLIAAHGATRLLERGGAPASEVGVGAGALFVAGAAVWLVADRAGIDLLGYPPYWVALTAAHFHVAGMTLPIVAGMLARRGTRLGALAVWIVVIAVPATAIGIGYSPVLERIAAIATAIGGGLVAVECLRARRWLAGAALCVSMPLAFAYAIRVDVRIGDLDPLSSMAATHGAANLLFAIAALLSLVRSRPAPQWRRGVPFGRARLHAVDPAAHATGTCDSLDDFAHAGYDPSTTAPAIRHFYEHVLDHTITIRVHWRRGFRLAGRAWHALASRMGQLALPIADGAVGSRIVALRPDGRDRPRAWIRTDAHGGPMFASSYAVHREAGVGYMNIAFPLPGGAQMSSICRFDPLPGGGVRVSSRRGGDCGQYLVIRGVALRLPLGESIDLRVEGAAVVGHQQLSLCGVTFLTIEYTIARQPDEARVEVAGDPSPA